MSKNSGQANTPDSAIAQPWISAWQTVRDGLIYGPYLLPVDID
jgi:hypothetical protein